MSRLQTTRRRANVRAQVPPKELSIFCRQLSLILGSDITLTQGLAMVTEQTENRILKQAIIYIAEQMDRSVSFGEAFAENTLAFPPYLVSMVLVGEQSGTLDVVFGQMADYYEKENRIRRRVSSAFTYPIMLTALMLAVISLLVVRILPMFEEILINMGGTMPAITQVLMSASGFIGRNILWIAIGLVVIIGGSMLFLRTNTGRRWADHQKITLPVVGSIQRRVLTARFSRSLAILLKSGVPLLGSLETMDLLIGNTWLVEKMKIVRSDLLNGAALTTSLQKLGIFPPMFMRLVTIGEQTGNLDDTLFKASSFFDEEVDEALERLTNSIEPVLIIVLSLIVAVILLSVMLPMIDIMARIG